MANRATGKGYENENFYDNIKFQFFGIENIHVMRTSLNKVLEREYLLRLINWLFGVLVRTFYCSSKVYFDELLHKWSREQWLVETHSCYSGDVLVHCSSHFQRGECRCSLQRWLGSNIPSLLFSCFTFGSLSQNHWRVWGELHQL